MSWWRLAESQLQRSRVSRPATNELVSNRLALLLHAMCPAEAVGVDAVHIPTWERHIKIGGGALVARVYTPSEVKFSSGRIERLSTRLAAKEAVLKALGTGIRGIALRDVEIETEPSGRPTVVLHGPAHRRAGELGLVEILVSLCHEDDLALAVAVGKGGRP